MTVKMIHLLRDRIAQNQYKENIIHQEMLSH